MAKRADFLKSSANIRVANQLNLTSLLLDGPKSLSELTQQMDLSFTALIRIVEETKKAGIIVPATIKNVRSKRGAKPAYVKLNEKIGVVAAIDLAGMDTKIAIGTMRNHILVSDTIPNVDRINRALLEKVTEKLKALLASPKVGGRPLVGICISCNGKIDKQTNDFFYVLRVDDYEHLNLRTYFRDRFQVDVNVFNDVHLSMVGEQIYGSIPPEAKDVLFVYLGETNGFALMFDGKTYEGAHGFAGEDIRIKTMDRYSENKYYASMYTLQDIRAKIHELVQNHPEHPLYGVKTYDFAEMCDFYKAHDPIVYAAVDESLHINAMRLLSLADLLDLEYIAINGKVLNFGDEYREKLISYFTTYDALRCQTGFLFSPLGEEPALLGALYEGTTLFRAKRFNEMTKRGSRFPNYNVTESLDKDD